MSEPAAAQAAAAPKSSDAARHYAHMIWRYRNAETVATMIFVGGRLGLFKAMAGAGAQGRFHAIQATRFPGSRQSLRRSAAMN